MADLPPATIELYYWPTPNGHKISIMLEECGLPYEVRRVDIGACFDQRGQHVGVALIGGPEGGRRTIAGRFVDRLARSDQGLQCCGVAVPGCVCDRTGESAGLPAEPERRSNRECEFRLKELMDLLIALHRETFLAHSTPQDLAEHPN